MNKKLHLNENVVRISAFITMTIGLIGLIFQVPLLFYFLTIDFAIRGFFQKGFLISILSKRLVNQLKLRSKSVFAPPKFFAARIGFVFSITIVICMELNIIWLNWIVGVSLVFCAGLESFFSICIGCYIFDWIFAPLKNKLDWNNRK
jgi:hypothetical protein